MEPNELKKKRMLNLLSDGKITSDVYNDYSVEYSSEKNRIIEKISKYELNNNEKLINIKLEHVQTAISQLLSSKKIDSEIINRFIVKIEIDAEGKPQIQYRFAE